MLSRKAMKVTFFRELNRVSFDGPGCESSIFAGPASETISFELVSW